MKIKFWQLAILLIIILSGFEMAKACVCIPQTSACQAYAGAEIVFVAKVLASRIEVRDLKFEGDAREVPFKAKIQVSRLAIKEVFTGIETEKEIEIETDNYSSCSFSLAKDTEYLVYGDRTEKTGKLTTGSCSGTKPVAAAGQDLEYLRTTKKGTGMSVNGFVAYNPNGGYFFRDIPKNNFDVLQRLRVTTVTLNNSESSFQAQINKDGTYNFENIPKGKYSLKVLLPESLKSLENYNPDIAEELGIKDQSLVNLVGHGCRLENFIIVDNGRVRGKVIDVNGKSVDDITVNLIPVNAKGQKIKTEEACYDNGLCLDTNKNGEFKFEAIKAGHYLIGIRSDDYVAADSIDAAFPATYFPGTDNSKRQKLLSFKKDRQLKISLSSSRRGLRIQIFGVVFFSKMAARRQKYLCDMPPEHPILRNQELFLLRLTKTVFSHSRALKTILI